MNGELIKQLVQRIEVLEADSKKRQQNQIQLPLDELSLSVLSQTGAIPSKTGTGSAATTNISLTGNVQIITVPAQPSGTIKINIRGAIYEFLLK